MALMVGGLLLALVAAAKPAKAAFPKTNGLIAFSTDRTTTANPDGDEENFTMRPDSAKITCVRFNLSSGMDVYTMKAHGTN
jgi:hypothetical protein